jgi:hypothetical protein
MYSIQDNRHVVCEAVAAFSVVLVAPAGAVTPEHELAVGQLIVDKLMQRSLLLPSYWKADGTEAEPLISSLDGMATLTPTLYFSVKFEPSVTLEACREPGEQLARASEAKETHCWTNRMNLIQPTEEFIRGIGKWAYSLRDVASWLELNRGEPAKHWTAASINAS